MPALADSAGPIKADGGHIHFAVGGGSLWCASLPSAMSLDVDDPPNSRLFVVAGRATSVSVLPGVVLPDLLSIARAPNLILFILTG